MALQADGMSEASVVYSSNDICAAAEKAIPENEIVHIDAASNARLASRLLVFAPKSENEQQVFELLDDIWRGEVVLLFNPEFSDSFKEQQKAFLQAFDTVYCFMPLAIKVFIQSDLY